MTDFNTPTEAEMTTFQEIFAKMQSALLAGSQLSKDFDALKGEVEGLRRDLQSVRNTNMALDDALTASRQRRDELETQLGTMRQERNSKVQELESALHERHVRIGELEGQLADATVTKHSLSDALENARNERDTAQLRVMELEDETKQQAEFIRQITERLENVYSILQPKGPAQTTTVAEIAPGAQQQVEPSTEPELVVQGENEEAWEYFQRVGRYPSPREARAAAQPRTEGGQFTKDDTAVAASPKWDEGGWR